MLYKLNNQYITNLFYIEENFQLIVTRKEHKVRSLKTTGDLCKHAENKIEKEAKRHRI